MARSEEDREDIMREATALVDRIEYQIPSFSDPVIVGFRRDGSASFFFGQNFVLQFNRQGELRRAYVDGQLMKAENRNLVRLRRERTDLAVNLVRHELTERELQEFLDLAKRHLRCLNEAITKNDANIVQSVAVDAHAVETQVQRWLDRFLNEIVIAKGPRVASGS